MCKNATSTAASTMLALRPMLVSLLTTLGVAGTQEGKAAIAAFDAADEALLGWKSGTSAQTVIQLIQAFTAAYNAVVASIPVPPELTALINIISAGIVMVIGILTGNQAPSAPAKSKGHDQIEADAESQVKALIPGYKVSDIDKGRAFLGDHTVVAGELKKEWNKGVDAAAAVDPKYVVLKIA